MSYFTYQNSAVLAANAVVCPSFLVGLGANAAKSQYHIKSFVCF
jgi:hypothetical protein